MTTFYNYDQIPLAAVCRAALLRQIISGVPHEDTVREVAAPSPKLLTARDAAKTLAVCEKTLWNLTKRGEIPAVRSGRSVRYDPCDLSRWIERTKSVGVESSGAL